MQTVRASDGSIVVGGTAADPTVAVADGGITTAKLAANAVTSANMAVPLTLSGSTGGGGSVIQATNSGNGQGLSGFATAANGGIGVTGVGLIGVHGVSGATFGIGVGGDAGTGTGVSGSGRTGVSGTSTTGTGVGGNSSASNGVGVSGNATGSDGRGVSGTATAPATIGVLGTASGVGIGVSGRGFTGVSGLSSATNGGFGVGGSASGTGGIGVEGTSNATNGTGVSGFSTNFIGVRGETNNPAVPGVRAVSAGASSANVGLEVLGRFFATGTKAAVVPLQDGQHVLLTAEESTEVWFSDYGTVQLLNGLAVVQIDREFLQTVNTAKDYHVFLTARGNPSGALYIDNETPSSFEIRETTGTANIKVSYRIVAKRKDFADERLKKVASPYVYGEPKSQSATSAGDAEGMKRMVEERERFNETDVRTAALP